MLRNGTLEPHDIKPERIADELRERTNSEDGLWFVSRYVAGNTRLVERVHRPALMWLQARAAEPDALVAYRDNRGMGKTDGFTCVLPLWAWASRPVEGTPLQGVNTCIAFVAPKVNIAANIFVANVERRLNRTDERGCRVYRDLYPWVEPNPRFWSLQNGLLLKRTLAHGMPSLMPLGMESVSTSLHPPIMVVDDPVHEQNYRSGTELRRINDWVAQSLNLTKSVHGVRFFVGNHWAVGDVQDNFHPERSDCKPEYRSVKVWERGIDACNACVNNRYPLDRVDAETGEVQQHQHEGEVFPIALAQKAQAEREERGESGPDIEEPPSYIDEVAASLPTYIFLTQHRNRLVDPRTLHFKKEHLRFWDWHYLNDGERAIEVMMEIRKNAELRRAGAPNVINTGREGSKEIIPLDALDAYILVDPAPSEEASAGHSQFCAALVGVERRGPRRFLLEEYAANAPEHVHINHLLDWYISWRVWFRRFGIEAVGYQSTIQDSLLTAAAGRGIHTLRKDDITMLQRLRSEGAQEDRIKYALSPQLELGHLYVNRAHRIFRMQHDTFGVKGAKHDLLDAISNLDRVLTTRGRSGYGAELAAAAKAREKRRRTGATGY